MAYTVNRNLAAVLVAALSIGVSACTLDEAEAPPVTGPSGFATTVDLTASPDILPEDGTSRSIIGIAVRDPNAQPIPNVPVRVGTSHGTLSAGQVSTGPDGRASVVFTAPLTMFPGFDQGTVATIFAVPVGTNFDNAQQWTVSIRLVPPSVIQVPGSPVAAFSFGPPNPSAGDVVLFDASASFDTDGGTIVSYEWDWGDGDVHGFGKNQDHDFPAAGTYFVTLTVIDDSGLKASVTRAVTIS